MTRNIIMKTTIYNNHELKNLDIETLDAIYERCYHDDIEFSEWSFNMQINGTYDVTHISRNIREQSQFMICTNKDTIVGFVVFNQVSGYRSFRTADNGPICLCCEGFGYFVARHCAVPVIPAINQVIP